MKLSTFITIVALTTGALIGAAENDLSQVGWIVVGAVWFARAKVEERRADLRRRELDFVHRLLVVSDSTSVIIRRGAA